MEVKGLWLLLFTIGVAAAEVKSSDLVEIEIDGEIQKYPMTVPSADSPVVEMVKEHLLGQLDLESFVKDLGRLGGFIRVAYNGIGAAGPQFQDLQNQVQRLGLDISKLCDRSAVTIASFKTTTTTILYELKSAYQSLLKGREFLAIDSFETLASLAGKMATAAKNLQREFENQEMKVTNTLDATNLRKAKEKIKISDTRAQQEKAEMNLRMQEKLAKEHEKYEAEFRAERKRYERKEDKAISAKSGFLNRLGNIFTSSIGLGNLFDDDSTVAARASKYREKSMQKLENEKEQRRLKQAALQSMAELTHEIKMAEKTEELAAIAVKALHSASESMKKLIILTKQAAQFWERMKNHCQEIADDRTQQRIEKIVEKMSKEERIEHWSSNEFKERMFIYMSKWVALNSVSSRYLEQIRITQQDLYNYILENPTYEESRQNLQQLVENFEKDLESDQKRIEEQEFRGTKEILELEAENNQKTEL